MPLGGESIGRAYVRILADGSGFSDDVKRSLRDWEPAFEAAGNKSSKDFWDGYDEETEKQADTSMKDLKKRMDRSTGRFQASGDLLGNEFMTGLRGHLEKRFKDVGTVMFANLNEELVSGRLDFTGLMSQLEDLRPLWARATQDIVRDQKAGFEDLDKSIRRYGEGLDKSGRSRQDFLRDLRAMAKTVPSTSRGFTAFNDRVTDLRKILGDANPKLTRFRDSMAKSGDAIGRAFGKGSRNNALNFIGRFIGGIAGLSRALSSFLKWPGLVAEQISKLGAKFQAAIDEAGSLRGALLSMASAGLPGLITALITTSVIVQTVTASLTVLASALVLTAGLVIALAGSLSFALVGALAAVALALVPAAVGIGALVIGITELNKKSKAFKDLKKEWKDLRAEVGKAVFGKDAGGLKGVTDLLKVMRPLLVAAGTAVAGLLESFGKNVKSKEFRDMMADITAILPGMVTQLGTIAGNLLLSVGRAFVAAEPLITAFLGWLNKITQAMADSGKGGAESPMARFFTDALASVKAVGGFISETIGLIGDLFSAGKDTGDSIFVTLTENVKQFRDWLLTAKADGSLQQFFDDAKKFGEKLGELVVAAGKLIAALDSPASRTVLFVVLDLAAKLITAIGDVILKIEEFNGALKGLPGMFQTAFGGAATLVKEKWGQISTFFSELPGKLAAFFSGLGTKIITAAGDLASQFGTWISGVATTVSLVPGQIAGFFTGLGGKILTAAGDIATQFGTWLAGLPVKAIEAVGKIVVGFIGLAGKMITAAGNILGAYTAWAAGVPQAAINLAANIVLAFVSLAAKIIRGAGNLASQFGTWVSGVPGRIRAFVAKLPAIFAGLAAKFIARAGSLSAKFTAWVSSLPGKARQAAANVVGGFAGLAVRIVARAGSLSAKFSSWVQSLPGKARAIAGQIASGFSGLAGKMIARAGSIVAKIGSWASGVRSAAARVATSIVTAFSGLASRIVRAIGTIVPNIKMPTIPRPTVTAIVKVIKGATASGGIFSGAQTRLIGEAGPEAVVPLNRSLSQVDPAVRELSAIAQGLKVPNMAKGGGNIGRQIDASGWTIITPSEDPRAVASEVVARMAAASYL